MAWAKVDDGWWCHPKVMALPMGARGLWVSALSWSCAQRRPDVPAAFLRMVGASEADAAPLVASGLWYEGDDGYEIHGWAEYQERSTSEKRADAGRKGGKASGESRRNEANAKQTDVASEANAEAGTNPVPSNPSPSQPSSSAGSPVDNEPSLWTDDEDEVFEAIADLRLAKAKTAGTIKSSAAGYRRSTRANLPAEVGPRVRELIGRLDEPARTIAEVVENNRDTRLLRIRPSCNPNPIGAAS